VRTTTTSSIGRARPPPISRAGWHTSWRGPDERARAS
jgi:hypothetical protein